jgi:hypothetical protein
MERREQGPQCLEAQRREAPYLAVIICREGMIQLVFPGDRFLAVVPRTITPGGAMSKNIIELDVGCDFPLAPMCRASGTGWLTHRGWTEVAARPAATSSIANGIQHLHCHCTANVDQAAEEILNETI